MAVTQMLSIGYSQTLLQNVVVALPSSNLCRLTCDDGTATFQVSNDPAFGTASAAVLSGSGYDNGYAFIRLTSAGPSIVNVRRWQA